MFSWGQWTQHWAQLQVNVLMDVQVYIPVIVDSSGNKEQRREGRTCRFPGLITAESQSFHPVLVMYLKKRLVRISRIKHGFNFHFAGRRTALIMLLHHVQTVSHSWIHSWKYWKKKTLIQAVKNKGWRSMSMMDEWIKYTMNSSAVITIDGNDGKSSMGWKTQYTRKWMGQMV